MTLVSGLHICILGILLEVIAALLSGVVSISVSDCVVGRVGHLDSTSRVPTSQRLYAFVSRLANHVLQTLVNCSALVTD